MSRFVFALAGILIIIVQDLSWACSTHVVGLLDLTASTPEPVHTRNIKQMRRILESLPPNSCAQVLGITEDNFPLEILRDP